jgi:polyphosphate glucokinase
VEILAIDLGGTHLKFRTSKSCDVVKVDSGPRMTPEEMMRALRVHTRGWKYDRVSLGYPGPVVHNAPLLDPHNLGSGWTRFDFRRAFARRPVRVINDAAMQALGSYEGGRMLFLGLGTGLGSAMVVEGVVQAMELAHMPWKKGRTYEEFLGKAGLERLGRKRWRKQVWKAIEQLSSTLESEYVVLGGGNAKLLDSLPKNVVLGSNGNAFKGAFLLWQKGYQRFA